ncbi:hypothetical protein EXIGLDRAFT_772756 [Exidia glandulosa HHB12029]|uniref:Uncharacterized protein n=1 Tax=Exidia glandulosa HHB12029 TaxID=1314781 RepID=A0A165F4W0_EXIGL|nr:hypothetical protein EXIGLDRAFT_772756 [Exidia glandulosa HHB12029]
MSYKSDRNDADPNPKRTIVSEPSSSRRPSNHSGDANINAAHALTPRGQLSRLETFFGRYVPSWDHVDVLCWRYWRYKDAYPPPGIDASFVFYRGAVLSLNHIWSRWCAADRIYKNQSYEWQEQRADFRKVMNRLAIVWDKWEDLKYEIEKGGYRSSEDCDSFATRVEDVRLLNALDKLFTAEQELNFEEVPHSVWYTIICKEKHKVKFYSFTEGPQRRGQI